ncbi:type II toxin-antitoxin system HicB family antitoxin [Methanothrix soehngenii]|uniref:type II toxin-antitoxin system HicB family antitoxin n=1 Tax=Methanothrix soehngenii TaxID=2223 RepID=UPI002FE41222
MRFDVVVRQDEDVYYVATVPELPGCHSQAKSLDELMSRIKEAILLCLEEEDASEMGSFIGVQVVEVEPKLRPF